MLRPRHILTLAGCCLATTLFPSVRADTPAPAPILPQLKRVADWMLANPARQPIDGWVYATFYNGLAALEETPGGEGYHAALVAIGEKNKWEPAERPYHADDICTTQMYLELYQQDHDAKMIAPTVARFDYVLAHPSPAGLSFDKKNNPHFLDRWSWCDSLFMAPPAWARLTAVTGNRAYLDEAVKQWWITTDFLYSKTDHLFFRDSTYFAKKEKNGAHVYWSRGNGWVIAGVARLLAYMPADYPDRPKFEHLLVELATELKSVQQPDGFWRASLLDPAAYPDKESSGTGLICYGIAWGIHHGILDAKTFRPTVDAAWAALASSIEPNGKVAHVQPVGAQPDHFDPESTLPFGTGAVLLAGTEMLFLTGQGPSNTSIPWDRASNWESGQVPGKSHAGQ